MSFEGKVAILIGGGSGIGAEVGRRLGADGAKVVIADLSTKNAEAVANEIIAAGGTAAFTGVDVRDSASVDAAVDFTVTTYGALNLAFNSAGVLTPPTPFADFDDETWRNTMEINALGTAWSVRAELRHFLANGGGVIVNCTSQAGLRGSPNTVPYVASKHAITGMTRTAGMEYAKSNIRVNAIAPGLIRTPMTDWLTEEQQAERTAKSAMGRFGEASEVAEVVLFLLSDKASFVNGAIYSVDGGGGA